MPTPQTPFAQIRNKVGRIFFLIMANHNRTETFQEIIQLLDSVIDHLRNLFGNPDQPARDEGSDSEPEEPADKKEDKNKSGLPDIEDPIR